ncbi:MAG: CBS domain-containing protein [Promethearchaeati archaeon SRVP18_Atabeyarchaeia-1]
MTKIQEVMSTNNLAVEIPGRRKDAMDIMVKNGLTWLPVVKKGTNTLVGAVSRYDLMSKPEEDQLALLMRRDPITVSANDDVKDAVKLMLGANIARLPVVSSKMELIGALTVTDVVQKVVVEVDKSKIVKSYVERDITCIWEGTPLPVAHRIMRLSNEQALPVLNDDGELVGIIGEPDFLSVSEEVDEEKAAKTTADSEGTDWDWDTSNRIIIAKRKLRIPNKPVKDVMIRNVETTVEQASVAECAMMMKKYGIDQLPVLNAKGSLSGVVRDTDLLRALI